MKYQISSIANCSPDVSMKLLMLLYHLGLAEAFLVIHCDDLAPITRNIIDGLPTAEEKKLLGEQITYEYLFKIKGIEFVP